MSYTDDYYFKLAKKKGLRARSYFKIEEIDKKYRLIKPGQKILDLGAAPGSWCQYLLHRTKSNCDIIAVDLQKIDPFPNENIKTIQKDVFDLTDIELPHLFDGIISDMAPKTSGIHQVDSARSAELVENSLYIAEKSLQKSGYFISKYLQGSEQRDLLDQMKTIFSTVKTFKPHSSRSNSSEIFFIAFK